MKHLIRLGLVTVIVIAGMTSAFAQESPDDPGDTGTTRTVTEDEVNDIARDLYCPVCENEPLHTCMATSCVEWRAEIRDQLEQGFTREEVIDSFVEQHGDQVLPIPEDPTLRILTFIGPLLVIFAAVAGGYWVYSQWQNSGETPEAVGNEHVSNDVIEDEYRYLLENDLKSDR